MLKIHKNLVKIWIFYIFVHNTNIPIQTKDKNNGRVNINNYKQYY